MSHQKNAVFAALALFIVLAIAWLLFNRQSPVAVSHDSPASQGIAEGVHYRTIENPLTAGDTQTSESKIPVLEFFWYGCPHCQAFEPGVRQWLKTASDDVGFQQMPVVWNEATRLHAGLFYLATGAENPEPLHDKLFEKIIELRPEKNLDKQIEQTAGLFTAHGIDASELKALIESDQVKQNVVRAEQLMRQAEVASTPTILVNGQWLVLNNDDVAKVGTFSVVDFLVQKAREQ